MNEIIPGLFLGSECNAMDTDTLKANHITHILTLNNLPLHSKYTTNFTYKFIYALDCLECDILTKFEECIEFIDDAINNNGAIIVHCVVGISRSATIVLAYIMKKRGLSFNDAFVFVKSKRSIISPNPNFLNQLQIFEQMQCHLNDEFLPYKRYRLHHCAQKLQEFDNTKSLKDIIADEKILKDTSSIESGTKALYKCRKCRNFLFSDQNLIPHLLKTQNQQVENDEALLGIGPRFEIETEESIKRKGDTLYCDANQLFVEPLDWMKDDIYQIEGKLSCPKCQCKIGSFTWIGEPCVCQEWVCPAFHISSQRIDKCLKKTSDSSS